MRIMTLSPASFGSFLRTSAPFSVPYTFTFTPFGASALITRLLNLSAATSSSTTIILLTFKLGVHTETTSPWISRSSTLANTTFFIPRLPPQIVFLHLLLFPVLLQEALRKSLLRFSQHNVPSSLLPLTED